MNTAIQGVYNGYSVANLSQVLAYTEGVATKALNPITLTTNTNYSRVYTLSLTIVSVNHANVNIVQANTSGSLLVRSGATYTITSEYSNSNGVVVNNWAYFKLAIQGLTLQFANTDWGETFLIDTVFSDGITTQSNQIEVITAAILDTTGNNQTLTVPMSMAGKTLTSLGGINLAINDVNEASKTYRVTYTRNNSANTTGTSQMYLGVQHGGTTTGWQSTYSLSGTQAYINSQIAGNGSDYDGLYFVNYAPDFQGQTSVSYTQEVLTTTDSGVVVPYVQETGNLIFNTTYTAPYAIGPDLTYTEDSSFTFSLGSITDLAGSSLAHETCGVGQGYNCYTVTATILGTFSGTNPTILTYSGDVAPNNTVTFTGTKIAVNALLASVQLIPPADYTDPLTIQVVVTRGTTPTTIFTGNITATCTSTHSEFSIAGGATFVIGNNTLNLGSITDTATSKNYTVTIDALQPSATYGVLTDLSGVGTWNGTGGVSSYGRLTISGTKAVLNTSLGGIRYTTGSGSALTDVVQFAYTQTQTFNSIIQGTTTIGLSNMYLWGGGNYSGSFVFDENTKMTYNLGTINTTIAGTAKAEITLGTAFSVANGGSITGWTKVSDTIWTFSGTKAAVNAALAATEFVPPADRVTSFTVDMKIYDDAVVKYSSVSFSATKTFSVRNTYSKFSLITPLQLSAGGNSAAFSLGSITDPRPENVSSAITYSIVLTPSSLTQVTSMSSAGTGGTTSWSGTALTLTGTKTQVNSHLALVTINYIGLVDSTITWAQTQTTNTVSQGSGTITVLKIIPQYMFLSAGSTARTNNLTTWDIDTLPNVTEPNAQFCTFNNNLWFVPSAGSTLNNISLNKSTPTSWTSLIQPVGVDVQSISGSKVGLGYRVYLYKTTTSFAITYTPDDVSFTTISLINGSTPIVSASLSFVNNKFYIMCIDSNNLRGYYQSIDGTTWTSIFVTGAPAYNILWPEVTYGPWDWISGNKSKIPSWVQSTVNPSEGSFQAVDADSLNGETIMPFSSTLSFVPSSQFLFAANICLIAAWNRADNKISFFSRGVGTGPGYIPWTRNPTNIFSSNNYPDQPCLQYGNSTWLFRNGNQIYTSTDAYTWTARSLGFTPYSINSIKYINGKFYALVSQTNNNSKLMLSTNGITWTVTYSFPAGDNWTEMQYTG